MLKVDFVCSMKFVDSFPKTTEEENQFRLRLSERLNYLKSLGIIEQGNK